MKYDVAIFSSAARVNGVSVSATWDELCTIFADSTEIRATKDGWCILPAKTRAGLPAPTHRAADIEHVSLAILDFDSGDLESALEQLQKYKCCIWETWKSRVGSQGVRLRAVLPLAEPISAAQWGSAWARLVRMFPDVDRSTKDCSRLHYLPAKQLGLEDLAPIVERWDGILLSLMGQEGESADVGSLPVTIAVVERLARRWQRGKDTYLALLGERLALVVAGLPWSEKGERDTILFRLCRALVEEIPTADLDSLAAIFRGSIVAINDPEWTIEKVRYKLGRAVAAANEKAAASAEANAAARLGATGRGEYAENEYPTDPHSWVIQKSGSYYVRFEDHYKGPYTRDEVVTAGLQWLAPAAKRVQLTAINSEGNVRVRALAEIMREYGRTTEQVEASLLVDKTIWDERRALLIEAVAPRREIEVREHADVAEWLQLLGGEAHGALLDWLAVFPRLEAPAPALYLHGSTGSGKTLLACALARLWGEQGPTSAVDAMGGFNDAISRCPLVFADEKLPCDYRGTPRTDELKELITSTQMTLRRKFLPTLRLRGSVRVILAANNLNMLFSGVHFTADDIAALGERLVYVQVAGEAAAWLRDRPDIPESWMKSDAILQHVHWLAANRVVRKGRLATRAAPGSMLVNMSARSGVRYYVCQWLAGLLVRPKELLQSDYVLPPVWAEGGKLWVNGPLLETFWKSYTRDAKPNSAHLQAALQDMSGNSRIHRKKTQYREFKIEYLIQWCNATDADLDAKSVNEKIIELESLLQGLYQRGTGVN